jgi:TldD protein
MERLAYYALDAAASRNVQYADVRVIESKTQSIATKNLELSDLSETEGLSLGVRILCKDGWGFASAEQLSNAGIIKAVELAFQSARVSARIRNRNLPRELAPVDAYTAQWSAPFQKDPFKVSIETKIGILLAASKIMRKVKGIDLTTGQMTFERERKLFVSTLGSNILQTFTTSACGIDASAFDTDGRYQTRSYPTSFGGQYAMGGFEIVEAIDLVGNAHRVADEALALCSAPVLPEKTTTVILESSQMGLQIHESCGHATESDRVFGEERNYAGDSFLKPHLLNKLQYGSNLVNICADATAAGGLGTYGFDDEGVPAQRVKLIDAGIFTGYLTSRETATRLGLERSGGMMRAESANHTPLIRMTNVSLAPGNAGTLADMIADTADGVYLSTNRSWSIGSDRMQFQFGTEIAWQIKNGKLGRIYRDPGYSGITPKFWGSCNAIGSESTLWGIPGCAKAQPCQMKGVGHASAPARFARVKVGGAIPIIKQECAK